VRTSLPETDKNKQNGHKTADYNKSRYKLTFFRT